MAQNTGGGNHQSGSQRVKACITCITGMQQHAGVYLFVATRRKQAHWYITRAYNLSFTVATMTLPVGLSVVI